MAQWCRTKRPMAIHSRDNKSEELQVPATARILACVLHAARKARIFTARVSRLVRDSSGESRLMHCASPNLGSHARGRLRRRAPPRTCADSRGVRSPRLMDALSAPADEEALLPFMNDTLVGRAFGELSRLADLTLGDGNGGPPNTAGVSGEMGFHRCWSRRGAASIHSATIFFAALLALVALICSTSRGALASTGCATVNGGGFNASAGAFGNKTIVGFAVGDTITFTITWSSSGSWLLRTANFTSLDDSPIFATSGSQTRSYTVTGDNQDKTLTQFTNDATTVTAACTAAVTAPTVTSISPTNGPNTGGASITITGTGFTGVTSVKFGSDVVSYKLNSDSSITATAPAGSGTVDVTVTTSGGTSATGTADQFTYADAPSAVLVTILPRADPRRRSPRSRLTPAPPPAWRSPGPTSPALRR